MHGIDPRIQLWPFEAQWLLITAPLKASLPSPFFGQIRNFGAALRCRLPKCRLSKCRLPKCWLSKYWLTKCWLSKCRLSKCWLSRCWLSKCQLSKCQLSKCQLSKWQLSKWQLSKCGLSKCRLDNDSVKFIRPPSWQLPQGLGDSQMVLDKFSKTWHMYVTYSNLTWPNIILLFTTLPNPNRT
jgi:uncharacterized protein YjbI with pentapeptide repeats